MHELKIVKSFIDDLLKTAENEKAQRVTKIYLRMGEFSEINEEILKHYFKQNTKDTVLQNAQISIEKSPVRELTLLSFDCD